jgi:hypothetical protein
VRRIGDVPHVLRRIACIKLLNVDAGCDAADVTYEDEIVGSARRIRATDVVTGVSAFFGVVPRRARGLDVFLCGAERLGVRERPRARLPAVPGVFVRDFDRDFFGVRGPLLTLRPRRLLGDADLRFAIFCFCFDSVLVGVDGDGRSSASINGRFIDIGRIDVSGLIRRTIIVRCRRCTLSTVVFTSRCGCVCADVVIL